MKVKDKETTILSSVFYGCECWFLTTKEESFRVEAAEDNIWE